MTTTPTVARLLLRALFVASTLIAVGALAARPAVALEVNDASQAELESLQGVGVALSGRILEARRQAPFRGWGDLLGRVKGLSTATARRLSSQGLTVEGAGYEASQPPPRTQREDAPR